MGRKVDPTRAKRNTGHRPKSGVKLATLPLPADIERNLAAPPPDLPPEVHEVWTLAMEELASRGLTPALVEGVRMMAFAAARHREASAHIAEHGSVVKGQRGAMVNPMVKVERDSALLYLRLAESYGLTVASRMRLGLMQLAGQSLAQSLSDGLNDG